MLAALLPIGWTVKREPKDPTASSHDPDGQITLLHFMARMKLARVGSVGLSKKPD
jgi:hypothetical protein